MKSEPVSHFSNSVTARTLQLNPVEYCKTDCSNTVLVLGLLALSLYDFVWATLTWRCRVIVLITHGSDLYNEKTVGNDKRFSTFGKSVREKRADDNLANRSTFGWMSDPEEQIYFSLHYQVVAVLCGSAGFHDAKIRIRIALLPNSVP